MKLDHKQLAAKYWGIMHPHVNFYALKEEQIQNQYSSMQKFLETLADMETPDHKGGFYDGNDKLVSAGNRVEHRDGRTGILIEALQDGDAQVKFDDDGYSGGTHNMVKWNNLRKI